MVIRETKEECRIRVVREVVGENERIPISLGDLTKQCNNKIKYKMFQMSHMEVANIICLLKEYKKFTHKQGKTEYIFIKWRTNRDLK